MAENTEMVDRQRKVIEKLQDAILEQPLYEPGEMGKAVEAHIAALRKLEDADA